VLVIALVEESSCSLGNDAVITITLGAAAAIGDYLAPAGTTTEINVKTSVETAASADSSTGITTTTQVSTECTQPSTAGYDYTSIPANAVKAKTGFNVTLTCATGYVGIASVTACGSNGQDYAVTGCVNTCTQPSTAGYVFTGVPANAVKAVSGFNVSGVACDTGYVGTASASVCSGTSAVYGVTGCSAIACTRPTTTGYNYNGEDAANCLFATGTAATCSASLTCATGFTGNPVATLCTSAGAYSVAGCTEVTTTTTTTAPASTATTAAPASTATTAAPASTATTAAPAAKAAVDAGVQVTPNKMGILIAFLALFFIH
jgi:hypothetical protein